jgi:hypothetical protein
MSMLAYSVQYSAVALCGALADPAEIVLGLAACAR